MTCDSGRPCKRCIQRGLQSTCEDAPRKRKKYLEDVPNSSLMLSRSTNGINSTNLPQINPQQSPPPPQQTQQPLPSQSQPLPQQLQHNVPVTNTSSKSSTPQLLHSTVNDTSSHKTHQATMFQHSATAPDLMHTVSEYFPELYNQSFQPENTNQKRRTNFLSSAADLEYATLSNILQENFGHHTTSNEGTPNSHIFSPALSPHNMPTNGAGANNSNGPLIPSSSDPAHHGKLEPPYKQNTNNSPSPLTHNRPQMYEDTRYPKCDETINQYFLGNTESGKIALFPDVLTAIENMKNNDPAVYFERNSKSSLSFTIGISHEDSSNNGNTEDNIFKEPEEIYEKVKKPFSYTPGYHSLIAYLRKRFNKPMLVKMAESMATYRPSFIACTNSLKEHDLIFMEQCFQRTLLTYDNIIKISGTPTIVWRRTGEIAYVGNEFCVLTGWKREELLGKDKRKFIVELLDDRSVLEYFQVFSRIAFGDFLGATMTECTLLTPNPEVKIRTGCVWTLKRDVFGIPMMIVGNFLPIL
ncbi:ERT1 Transcription activator of gluconeogenesis ERT1 [Candida maltosa Xu316]